MTPCVGLCSTTYGDLVCRGCKRFIHEIVGWNSFTEAQKALVIKRLNGLRGESLLAHVEIRDPLRLTTAARVARAALVGGDGAIAFEVLRRVARQIRSLSEIGCASITGSADPATVRDRVEAEFLLRSQAHFEHGFRMPFGTYHATGLQGDV